MSILTSFFGNTKAVLGAAAAIAISVFLAVFKARGKEIKEQEEQIEELERENTIAEMLVNVNIDIEKEYIEEEEQIEEEYSDKKDELFQRYTDKPLTASLLSKLRNVQGLQNQTSDSPK